MKLLSLLIYLFLGIGRHAQAQDFELTARESSRAGVRFEGSSKLITEDEKIDFRNVDSNVYGSIPLYSRLSMDSWAKYWRLSFDPYFSRRKITTNAPIGDLDINTMNWAFSSVLVSKDQELYWLRAALRSQRAEGSSADNMGQAIAIGSYHFSFDLIGLYGIFYGDQFNGHKILLPILGVKYVFADSWKLTAILPLSLKLEYADDPSLTYAAFLQPEGAYYKVENNDRFSGRDSDLYTRLRRVKTGFEISYKFKPTWSLKSAVGFISRQKLTVSDSQGEVTNTDFKNGFFFNLGLEYRFGGQKNSENGDENAEVTNNL